MEGAGGLPWPTSFPKPSSFPKPQEVRLEALDLSKKVLECWKRVETIVERWEAIIENRWMKKTKQKRKRILLDAWPDMASMHRPDINAFKTKSHQGYGDTRESRRDAYMWPYINLEDLLTSNLFLLLLNSRGRNLPAAFARADFDAMHIGHITGVVMPAFLNHHVMMFTDRHTPETYGELIAWDGHPEAFDWLVTQRGLHPGEGLLVLEIQHRLYQFLLDCCKGILHDKSEAEMEDSEAPILPEPSSLSSNKTAFASLATIAAEGPYRLPMNLDLKRLQSLLKGKLEAAKDHLWALREDPGFYAASVLDARDHRQECLLDYNGGKHPLDGDPFKESILWDRVVSNVVVSAIVKIEIWNSLYEQVIALQALREKHLNNISPGKNLPGEYALAFYKLLHHLDQFSKGPIGELKTGFVASPPMRRFFEREPQDPANTIIRVRGKKNLESDKVREELIWIFTTLFDDHQLFLVGLNILMDELDRLIEKNSKAKELVSSWVADQISDLFVISQCTNQIKLYQPWAASFEDAMAEKKNEIQQNFLKTQKPIAQLFRINFSNHATPLGIPSDRKFHYPVHKRKTRENTESMRRSEQNLDMLWRAIDQEIMTKNAMSPCLKKILSERILQRTPEWIEPAKANIAPKVASPQHLATLQQDLEHSTESTINDKGAEAPKNKVKTRGPTPSFQAESDSEANPIKLHEVDKQPTFRVDRRAHKVFKTIFFIPSTSSQPGEVAWGDFLHAMSSTGFMTEKLYGSVWQFIPTNLDVERGIQFHEPHPSGRIPYTTARRFGRRLSRAYGWDGSMFVME